VTLSSRPIRLTPARARTIPSSFWVSSLPRRVCRFPSKGNHLEIGSEMKKLGLPSQAAGPIFAPVGRSLRHVLVWPINTSRGSSLSVMTER